MNTRYGAGGGTRTHTVSLPTDFESASSTIPTHRHFLDSQTIIHTFLKKASVFLQVREVFFLVNESCRNRGSIALDVCGQVLGQDG